MPTQLSLLITNPTDILKDTESKTRNLS